MCYIGLIAYSSLIGGCGPGGGAEEGLRLLRQRGARRDQVRTNQGNSFISPTRSGTTEIYIFGPAGAGIQNKICNIHLIDIVLQVQKYLEVQVFLVLQKYLEYQKQWNCSKLSERDTDMQNNIVKLRQRVRQG